MSSQVGMDEVLVHFAPASSDRLRRTQHGGPVMEKRFEIAGVLEAARRGSPITWPDTSFG